MRPAAQSGAPRARRQVHSGMNEVRRLMARTTRSGCNSWPTPDARPGGGFAE